ncbi:hypothetical protein Fmac_024540 [Flemingia macrophylla]|uniref:SHSP domain-containing protein n=1 Tax=Flemingia macrophylla TaxID=520843 RepID=A0ABD1LPP0_9FABA
MHVTSPSGVLCILSKDFLSFHFTLTATLMVSEADLKSMTPEDDQCFLMYFIAGLYFGPDIKGESTQKSVFQRVAEGLPPYTFNQLRHSFVKVVDLENIYCMILRNSDKSLTLSLLRRFLQGQAPGASSNYPQFPDLFPPELHPQSRFNNRIHSLVFINNPDWSLLSSNDVERFKRLCGMELLHVEREDVARLQLATCFDVTPVVSIATNVSDDDDYNRETETSRVIHGVSLTGSAAMGQVGSIVGPVDIGECEDAYLFRVALPGVKRDENLLDMGNGTAYVGQLGHKKWEFSCEVDVDGTVSISGVTTTGEKMVYRHSEMFEMQTRNLCPPGQFSISFKLPGPVDPDQFSGNFGTDGILEGIVTKEEI